MEEHMLEFIRIFEYKCKSETDLIYFNFKILNN